MSSYVLQNEQLLKFIQCDEVIPVANLEEVDCQLFIYCGGRSAKKLLMEYACFDHVYSVSLNSFY